MECLAPLEESLAMEGNQSFTINLTVPKDIFKIMWMQSYAANTKPTTKITETVYIYKQNPYHPTTASNY